MLIDVLKLGKTCPTRNWSDIFPVLSTKVFWPKHENFKSNPEQIEYKFNIPQIKKIAKDDLMVKFYS